MANLNDLQQSFWGGGNLNDAQQAQLAGIAKPSFDAARRRYTAMLTAQGLSGENYQHESVSNTTACASGTVYYMLMPFLAGDVVTNLWFSSGTISSVPTLTKAGIYTRSPISLVASSADVSSTFTASTGNKLVALSTPYTVPTTDAYWVAFVFVGTTGPALCRSGNIVANCQVFGSNPGSSGFQTGQTDLPNTGVISFGTTALCFWAGWN